MLKKNLLFLACTALGTTAVCFQTTAKAATISVGYGNGAEIAFPGNGAVYQIGEKINFRLDAPWSVSGTGPGNVVVKNDLVVAGDTLASQQVYTNSIASSTSFRTSSTNQLFGSRSFSSPGTYTAFGRLTGSINSAKSEATTSSVSFRVVPEPFTILGTGTALAFGTFFKRRFSKNKEGVQA